jgi:hypothetical protein
MTEKLRPCPFCGKNLNLSDVVDDEVWCETSNCIYRLKTGLNQNAHCWRRIAELEKKLDYFRGKAAKRMVGVIDLTKKLSVAREALAAISNHQSFVGGSLAELSTTKRIADNALKTITGEQKEGEGK